MTPISTPPPLPTPRRPIVVLLFRIYCWALVAFMLIAGVMGFLEATGRMKPELGFFERVASIDDPARQERLIQEKIKDAKILLGISIVGLPAFLVGALMPVRRWSYIYGIVLLSVSCLLCFTIAKAIALLIFWNKPETQRYFGR